MIIFEAILVMIALMFSLHERATIPPVEEAASVEQQITEPEPEPVPEPKPAPVERHIIGLVNDERSQRGLNRLIQNRQLDRSARLKCEHMQQHEYWAHSGGGREWSSFIYEQGSWHRVGENLAKDFSTDSGIVRGWLDSPTHRDNLLGDYRYIGIAQCDGVFTNLTVKHMGVK